MIDEALYSLLSSDSGVNAIVSTRVYPLVIPQHEAGDSAYIPCVVYTKVGAARTVRYTGTDNVVQATYQIDSYATTYRASAVLADAVRVALTDYSGTVSSTAIKTINIESEFALEDPDPGLYRITQTFTVWYVE